MQLLSVNIVFSTAKKLKKYGWNFDWDKSFGAISQKIAYLEDDKIQGLVEFEEVPSSLYNIIYRIELAPENICKERAMAKILILVNTNPSILKYDNRKAIELAQTLGRPLTSSEYETLKIKKKQKPHTLNISYN